MKLAIFVVLAMHVLLFGGLLMQGCKPDSAQQPPVYGEQPAPPPLAEPEPMPAVTSAPPDLATNAPAAPAYHEVQPPAPAAVPPSGKNR